MNTRAKGVQFERKVARAFEKAGCEVRGLESGGDHLVISRGGILLASECKNQARLQLPTWWRQAKADAVKSSMPTLTINLAGEMLTLMRTADLLRLVSR